MQLTILPFSDPCSSNPCGQNGKCISQGTVCGNGKCYLTSPAPSTQAPSNGYICQCNEGYYGQNCEKFNRNQCSNINIFIIIIIAFF